MTSEKLLFALSEIEDAFIKEAEDAYHAGKLPRQKNNIKYLAAAAVLFAVLWGVVMRPAVIAEAAQSVLRWFTDHVSYHFRTETALRSVSRYELQVSDLGYRLVEEEYLGDSGSSSYRSADRKNEIRFLYGLSDGEVRFPGTDLDYKLITDADGEELHYIFPLTDGQEASLTWVSSDGQIVFSISGELSEEELVELHRRVVCTENISDAVSDEELQPGFEGILSQLTEGQAYAVWQPESVHPILLVAERGTYEIDGVNGTIFCQVYGLQDNVPKYLGQLFCGGTAYPLRWNDRYLYTASPHSVERYEVSEQTGSLVLSDGLCYLPSEEGYRVRRDLAVTEVFDENGEPGYASGGEWLNEESGEDLFLKMIEESADAEIIRFIPYRGKEPGKENVK